MRKMDPAKAKSYVRLRTVLVIIYLLIGVTVSFGVVLFTQQLSSFSVMGIPLPYYMGAQGAVVTFIALLFVNAIVSDAVDRKYGINPKHVSSQDEDQAANQ
ncbi:MAG: sodium/substrate symporter small subunit [Halobacillus sp.]|uniref:DUF4212 domain-containing protein n=1 Tax=Halobacillus sp. TaxID=56800 RepID=UPI003BB1FB67